MFEYIQMTACDYLAAVKHQQLYCCEVLLHSSGHPLDKARMASAYSHELKGPHAIGLAAGITSLVVLL